MPKKETVTQAELLHDIKSNLRQGKELTEEQYRKERFLLLLVALAAAILSFIRPELVLYTVLSLLAFVLLLLPAHFLILRHKLSRISIDDYEIQTAILSDKAEEHYQQKTGKHHYKNVSNYDLRFEGGKRWRIPRRIFSWSKERPLSDSFLYGHVHRGDEFFLALHKETGEIAMAYPANLFHLKITEASS
ncbi:MAG: hypothetical protein IJY20_00340 [Clostridia bacterium]|nr:hypothetical protein [Clostridia bacterium]